MPQSDIPIGDQATIPWVSIDQRYDTAVSIDQLLPDADWFWSSLEGHCVSDCCGIDAFDLSPEGIRWAAGDDVPAPAAISWRPDERGDVADLTALIATAITKIEQLDADVVRSSTVFNQHFDTQVFLKLLSHIHAVLDTIAAG